MRPMSRPLSSSLIRRALRQPAAGQFIERWYLWPNTPGNWHFRHIHAGDDVTMRQRRIVIAAFPGVQPLDVVGPAQVFAAAGAPGAEPYRPQGAATPPDPIPPPGGYASVPPPSLSSVLGAVDTLIVAGREGARAGGADP